MTEIWWGALLLLALASLFVLLPGVFLRERRIDTRASNRDWFLQRRAELENTDETRDSGIGRPGAADSELAEDLLQDARLRMLEEADADAQAETGASGSLPFAVLLGVLVVLSGAFYWKLGAGADVALKRELDAVNEQTTEADYRRLMLKVEDRAAARPDNLYYQGMLGRFYMNEGDYSRARALYAGLAEKAPNDAMAAALAAQAGFLASGRQLTSEDQLLAERALAVNPHQRTALGLLGMASFEAGEFQAAISYWERLLVMENPQSDAAQMIRGVIDRARAQLGGEALAAAPASPHAAGPQVAAPPPQASAGAEASAGAGVTLRLELAQGMSAAPGDTVFVFARNPALDTRMPVAVKRLTAAQLPVTLRLDDASSMAGQKISELERVEVVARISPSGQPGEQYATFQASRSDLPPGSGEQVHTLVLRPVGDS
ncbi:MAG: c-type cytochrome biogenesis protein CcmI [Halieaceae bacterium]|nr:c-type cytochrome biogenesis protein CcmI [Halieaceae bacterium]